MVAGMVVVAMVMMVVVVRTSGKVHGMADVMAVVVMLLAAAAAADKARWLLRLEALAVQPLPAFGHRCRAGTRRMRASRHSGL